MTRNKSGINLRYVLLFLGTVAMASCKSIPASYVKSMDEYTGDGANSLSTNGRSRSVACEVRLFYDVICHGGCPPTKKYWNKNKEYRNCSDGLSYHCAKDNTTGEYVETCAEPVRCENGTEPRLVFPEGHVKLARVICRYCAHENSYNPYEVQWSNTSLFSSCQRWKRQCTGHLGKIRCEYKLKTEKYWSNIKCRCDNKKGYIQKSALCPSQPKCEEEVDLICEKHQCSPSADGMPQELLKDSCCTPICSAGYQRNDSTDVCVPLPSTTSSSVPIHSTKVQVEENTTKENSTNAVTTKALSVPTETTIDSSVPKDVTTTAATAPNKSHEDESCQHVVTILSTLLGVSLLIVLVLIIGIVCYRRRRKKKKRKEGRKKAENGGNASHEEEGALLPGNASHEEEGALLPGDVRDTQRNVEDDHKGNDKRNSGADEDKLTCVASTSAEQSTVPKVVGSASQQPTSSRGYVGGNEGNARQTDKSGPSHKGEQNALLSDSNSTGQSSQQPRAKTEAINAECTDSGQLARDEQNFQAKTEEHTKGNVDRAEPSHQLEVPAPLTGDVRDAQRNAKGDREENDKKNGGADEDKYTVVTSISPRQSAIDNQPVGKVFNSANLKEEPPRDRHPSQLTDAVSKSSTGENLIEKNRNQTEFLQAQTASSLDLQIRSTADGSNKISVVDYNVSNQVPVRAVVNIGNKKYKVKYSMQGESLRSKDNFISLKDKKTSKD